MPRRSCASQSKYEVESPQTRMSFVPDTREFKEFSLTHMKNPEVAAVLRHSWQSYKIKRSQNAATILLLGVSGAGKSSTINSIFAKEITEVRDDKSGTMELIEITGVFPSEFLGISNSKFHVIDTPGFNDTIRGMEFDADVMLSVKEFFKNKGYFPNIVLVALNYMDIRMDGEFSHVVKMFQSIRKMLLGTVVDKDYPNLVIVLTHLCSAKKGDQIDPQPKIQLVKRLVAQHIGILDCPVVVAENCPEDYELEKVTNDYFMLPNEELFPQNIFLEIKKLTETEDPIGCYIIQEGYRRLQHLQIQFTKQSHAIAGKRERAGVVADLMHMQVSTDTELGNALTLSWQELAPEQMTLCRLKPVQISTSLKSLGYENFTDLPRSHMGIMKLFQAIAPDEIMLKLMERSLNLRPVQFNFSLRLGQAYSIVTDSIIPGLQMVSLGRDVFKRVGCLLPNNVDIKNNPTVKFYCEMAQSDSEYRERRLRQLGVQVSYSNILGANYSYRSGYNVATSNSTQSLTAVYEKQIMQMECVRPLRISEDFQQTIRDLPTEYDVQDSRNIDKWSRFFRTYGTHYVSSAFIGGSVTFEINGIKSSQMESISSSHKAGLSGFLKLYMGSVGYNDEHSTSATSSMQNDQMNITVSGGNGEAAAKLTRCKNYEEFESCLTKWEETILDNPMVSELSMKLGEVSDVVRSCRPEIVNEMKYAFEDLYQAKPASDTSTKPIQESRVSDTSPPPKDDSCFTAETLIATRNGYVPICHLKAGDLVLNGSGEDVKILAVARTYSQGPTKLHGFCGFQLGQTPFFTEAHPFLSPAGNIVTPNRMMLESLAPHFIWKSSVVEMPERDIHLIGFKPETVEFQTVIVPKLTKTVVRDEEMQLYFLVVEGDGSYIANGFVTFGEAPNFVDSPKTFYVIYSTVSHLKDNHVWCELDSEAFQRLRNTAQTIKNKWKWLVATNELIMSETAIEHLLGSDWLSTTQRQTLNVLSDPFMFTLGCMLYSMCGEMLYNHLEHSSVDPREFVVNGKSIGEQLFL